jgi:ECF transporter S component (folate family)
MKNKNLQKIIFAALMVAIGIVLSSVVSFSYPPNSTIIRFGIGYLPLIIVSIVLGPRIGFYSSIVQDILAYFVYIWVFGVPSGPFFPGFTLNSVLYGVVPGLLYNLKIQKQKLFLIVNFSLLIILLLMGAWGFFNISWIILLIENRLSEGMSFSPIVIYLMLILGEVGIIGTLIFLYQKRHEEDKAQRIIFSIIILQVLVTLILTPLWVTILYKIPFWPQLPLRIIKAPIEIFIYSVLLIRIIKIFKNYQI